MKWKLWIGFFLVTLGVMAQTVNWKQIDNSGILYKLSSPTNRLAGITGTAGYFPYWGPGATNFGSTNVLWSDGLRLAIGTTTPNSLSRFHIDSTNSLIYLEPTADDGNLVGVQMLSANGTIRGGLTLNSSSGEVKLGATAGYFTTLYTGGAEAVRLSATGANLLLGTTTAGTSLAKGFVQGAGTAATTFPADVWQGWGSDIAGGGDFGWNLKTEGANGWYRFGTNATFGGALTLTNNLTIGSTTGNATAIVWSAGGSATLDFGSIAATASEDLTITVTGAAVNDTVEIGLPAAPAAGIAWNAFVSSANTVTVRAGNYTALPVDPASATYKVRLFRN